MLCPPRAAQDPAFLEWFGDSQALCPLGLPLLLYHGTEARFDAFDTARIPRSSSRPAVWCTPSHHAAGFYGPTRIPLYLRARRVLRAPTGDLTYWVRHALDANLLAALEDAEYPAWDAVRFVDVVDGDTPADVWAVLDPMSLKSPAARAFDPDDPSLFA